MIKLEHDTLADVLHLTFYDGVHDVIEELSPGLYGSFDVNQQMYALEIHGISNYTDNPEEIEFTRIGQIAAPVLTVEQFAELHDMNPSSVRNMLQQDQKLPDDQKKLPGAFKEGGEKRGVWKIPLKAAESWVKSNRGRPQVAVESAQTR